MGSFFGLMNGLCVDLLGHFFPFISRARQDVEVEVRVGHDWGLVWAAKSSKGECPLPFVVGVSENRQIGYTHSFKNLHYTS